MGDCFLYRYPLRHSLLLNFLLLILLEKKVVPFFWCVRRTTRRRKKKKMFFLVLYVCDHLGLYFYVWQAFGLVGYLKNKNKNAFVCGDIDIVHVLVLNSHHSKFYLF